VCVCVGTVDADRTTWDVLLYTGGKMSDSICVSTDRNSERMVMGRKNCNILVLLVHRYRRFKYGAESNKLCR
jgi:hypothetical protein